MEPLPPLYDYNNSFAHSSVMITPRSYQDLKQYLPQHIPQHRPQQPLVFSNEWTQHSLYPQIHQHHHHQHTFLPSFTDTVSAPRIKQEELGGFPNYPLAHHHSQPRSYDSLNLHQHHLVSLHTHHPNTSDPYPTLLSPLHPEISISRQSQQPTYYSSQFGDTVHAAEVPPTTDSLSPLAGYTDQAAIVGCDPRFVSAVTSSHPDTHSTLQQDNMKPPLQNVLEGWHDNRPSSLSRLTENELEMVNMEMVGMVGVVEDAVGEEDAEGEDEWVEPSYHPQYMHGHGEVVEVEKSGGDAHVHVNDDDVDSFEEAESDESLEDDDDGEFVIHTRSSRPRSQSARYNPYADSSTPTYFHGSTEHHRQQSSLAYDRSSIQNQRRYTSTSSASSRSPSIASPPLSSSTTKRSCGNRRRSQPGPSSNNSALPIPIPVPNLTKKSRGRRVPTMSSLEDLRSAASGAGRKRQSVGGKSARMYLCEVEGCGKCFARGEHLKRHVRSIHTYEKPHRCPHPSCGKNFSRHDNLVQHLRVHKDYMLPRSPSSSSISSSPLAASVAT